METSSKTYDLNNFKNLKKPLSTINDQSPDISSSSSSSSSTLSFIDLYQIDEVRRLPFSHRLILESLIRNENFSDAAKIINAASLNTSAQRSPSEKDAKDAIWNFDAAARENLSDACKGNETSEGNDAELDIQFLPSRILFQDFSCLSPLLDLAALRDVARQNGLEDDKINPAVAVDILLDHSMTSDFRKKCAPSSNQASRPTSSAISSVPNIKQSENPSSAAPKKYLPPHLRARIASAQQQQQQQQQQQRRGSQSSISSSTSALSPEDAEWQRNKERFEFIKWCGQAFDNVNVIPPVSGLSHQVFVEYSSNLVQLANNHLIPQTVIGTDTHTASVNGLGILGFTTGSVECECAMFGEGVILPVPRVVGFRLKGLFSDFLTSTDIVIAIVKKLKSEADMVCGKIVEFFGETVMELSVSDRMAIAQMAVEAGVLAAFFPTDAKTKEYFRNKIGILKEEENSSSASPSASLLDSFLDSNGALFQRHLEASEQPRYEDVIEFDVEEIVCCATGPRGAAHRVPLDKVGDDFNMCREEIAQRQKTKSSKEPDKEPDKDPSGDVVGEYVTATSSSSLSHGDVITADIVDYTNATFPSVLLASGLLAQKAVESGLKIPSHVEATLRLPRCRLADLYLRSTLSAFQALGFKSEDNSSSASSTSPVAASGCGVVLASVMSSKIASENKMRANYLVYPPLVVAYALSGNVTNNLKSSPLCRDVMLKDLWPSRSEIHKVELDRVKPQVLLAAKAQAGGGVEQWSKLETPKSLCFEWNDKSTYIQRPRYLDRYSSIASMGDVEEADLASRLTEKLSNCRALVIVGDSFSADHISLAGSMDRESAAGQHLFSMGVVPRYFYSYGSRSGNDRVMVRGTFAHAKMDNKMAKKKGAITIHHPSGNEMGVFDACARYNPRYREGIVENPLVVFAGKDFGKGPAREWAVKGPWLMGVRVILAESFNPTYEKSLIQIGILPLRIEKSAKDLGITGRETFSFEFRGFDDNAAAGGVCHGVRVSVNDGLTDKREFGAWTRFRSQEAVRRVLDRGFFAQSVGRVLRVE